MKPMTVHYDSISALCAAQPSARNAQTWEHVIDNGDGRDADWFGVADRRQVIEAVEGGWADGVARMFAAIGEVDALVPQSIRRRKVRGDQGDELDIHRVRAGQLATAWSRTRRKASKSPRVVRIVAQVGAMCGVKAEAVFWRGAACAVLADTLERAGYRVEIDGYSTATNLVNDEGTLTITFPIKAADAPLDIAALASVVCLAGFHRHYIFKARTAVAEKCARGMGATKCGVPESLQTVEDCIHVSLDDINTEQQARGFLAATLAGFSVEAAA